MHTSDILLTIVEPQNCFKMCSVVHAILTCTLLHLTRLLKCSIKFFDYLSLIDSAMNDILLN